MLEVQEDDENQQETASGNNSGVDSNLSGRSSLSGNDEKTEKPISNKSKTPTPPRDEKKVLNSLVSTAIRNSPAVIISQQQQPHSPKINISIKPQAILQHRGITLKKAQPNSSPKTQITTYCIPEKKEKTTIQLPEAIKRKLSENLVIKETKKINLGTTNKNTGSHTQAPNPKVNIPMPQPVTIKTEAEEELTPGTVITLPQNDNNSTPNNNNTTSNGFTPSVQEIDFSQDIIFETNSNEINTSKNNGGVKLNNDGHNQGLTPIFFKNLCNSSRHEAFGLYVANIMNRLSKPAASKLELQILRSVTNILSEDTAS